MSDKQGSPRVNPYQQVTTRMTSQTEPIPGPTGRLQVVNNAGGYVFEVDTWARLRRFLILGTLGGTYYVGERKLTADAADVVFECARLDGQRLVRELVDVSVNARAPRVQPTLFALAIACAADDEATRTAAMAAVNDVCRTATHLFTWLGYVKQFRGTGSRGMKSTLSMWYEMKTPEAAAYQAVKYRQRDGFSHRDVLRIAHPNPLTDMGERGHSHAALFDWITHGTTPPSDTAGLRIVEGYEKAQAALSAAETAGLVGEYDLPWEALQSDHLNDASVWNALLDRSLPYNALVRQLPRLTRLGVAAGRKADIAARLQNPTLVTGSKIHPLTVLNAMVAYRNGVGREGRDWNPVGPIIDALDEAFYLAFGNVEPANKRTLLALDVSGSMTSPTIAGTALTPRDASAAMALVTARTELDHSFMAFSCGFIPLPITPRQRLDDAVRTVSGLPFEGTDCAVPMLWAAKTNAMVDTFVVYTDSETWAGSIHPVQALRQYREQTGIAARLVVVGMTATGFTIADPDDPGMLDVVGFDTATPDLINGFSRGG